MVRGSSAKNAASRSGSYAKLGGICQSSGPNFSRRCNRPDAKKLASGVSTPCSRFMCVMKREPFTAKTKLLGVSRYHAANRSGRCSE